MLDEKGCPSPRRSVSITEGIHATLPLLTMVHESSPYIKGPKSTKPHSSELENHPDVEAPLDFTHDSSDITHDASQFPVSHALAYLFLFLLVDSMLEGFVDRVYQQINHP